MASRANTDHMKEQLKILMRYGIRIVPIVVIVGAIVWFFLLRSPDNQTNTSGTTNTGGSTPETTVSTQKPTTQQQTKVTDTAAMATTTDGKDGKGLPETGPADTLAIFAVPALVGTLFWEWRLRRAK